MPQSDNLELTWIRGEFSIQGEAVRACSGPEPYRHVMSWGGDEASPAGPALALSRIRLPITWEGFLADQGKAQDLLGFYRRWGPLGLAHHAFVKQVHVPRERGFVWQWDLPLAGYRRITESLDGEHQERPAGTGWPTYPSEKVPAESNAEGSGIGRSIRLATGWHWGSDPEYRETPPTAWVLTEEPYHTGGWHPASEFYRSYLLGLSPDQKGRPQRFPSIIDATEEFWLSYAEPLLLVRLAISDFQRIWHEAVEGASFHGAREDRLRWLETGMAPHLRKVHPRVEVDEDGTMRRTLWAPSLLAAAYFELAALVASRHLGECERCEKPIVSRGQKRRFCSSTCSTYARQWTHRHPGEPLPKRRWDSQSQEGSAR